ncbi:MAG: hypothetical protein KC468_21355 [Myxococcales bacterium]|nr:hypothetical protein [Myxococcales bacterium]
MSRHDESPREPELGAPRRARALWLWTLVVLLGVSWLYATCLGLDYAADDFWHIATLEGLQAGDDAPYKLYAFAEGDPAETAAHLHRGTLPWWTVPDWQFVMVRPLSSLTIALDHRLAPRAVWLHHLHSLAWVWLVIVAAALWLRQFASLAVAGVAVVLFAIDDSVGIAMSWIANRCAFVSMAFALLALAINVRRTRTRTPSRGAAVLEALAWALAFCGGEYALCGVGYLVAWHLCAHEAPWAARARACAIGAAVTLVFLVVFSIYGSPGGLAEYNDPLRDPVRFIRAFGHKLPRMLGETWLSIGCDSAWIGARLERWPALERWLGPWGESLPTSPWRHALLCAAGLPPLLGLAWLSRRVLSRRDARIMSAAALGSLLATIPLCSTNPQTRLLVFPSLGAAVAIAALLVGSARALWDRRARRSRTHVTVALAGLLGAGGLAFVDTVLDGQRTRWFAESFARGQAGMAAHVSTEALQPPAIDGAHVVVLSTPSLLLGVHGMSMNRIYTDARPQTWHTLTFGWRPYMLKRTSSTAFVLSSIGSSILSTRDERSFRPPDRALRPGDAVDAGLFVATVKSEREPGQPLAIEFDFKRPLEDPALRFFASTKDGLTPLTMPQVGGSVVVSLPMIPMIPIPTATTTATTARG